MKKLFSISTLLLSTMLSKGALANVNSKNLREQTSSVTINKIGNGGATCLTTNMTKEETIEALNIIQSHILEISPNEREILREKIISILNEIED